MILEVVENVLLDQTPHPNLLLGPPPALQLTTGQHGLLVRLHYVPDLRDALGGVRGGAHHLKGESRRREMKDARVNSTTRLQ